MDMMFATVCAFFLGEKVLVPNRFCVRVAGFPECLMMMQIRLPLLNGLLGVLWTPCRSALLLSLLRTSWIRHVGGGTVVAVQCCLLWMERMSAPMRPMAIIVLLSSGPTTMMSVGTVLVFFSVGVMPVCIEIFLVQVL